MKLSIQNDSFLIFLYQVTFQEKKQIIKHIFFHLKIADLEIQQNANSG